MTDQRPLCARCGLPARYVRGRALVNITLELDGVTLGKVNRVSDMMELPEREYECGLGHRWKIDDSLVVAKP